MIREPTGVERHQVGTRREQPIEPASDPNLIERARRGDTDALAEIVRSRMDAVYRLALAIAGDEADAADITQDSFVAVWRQLSKLRDPERFDAWLHRIVVNAARMAARGHRRRRVREIPTGELASVVANPVSTSMPSDGRRLAEALNHLPVEQRALLALYHLDGRSISEVAEILGIPEGTVKSRLFSARRALDGALARADAI